MIRLRSIALLTTCLCLSWALVACGHQAAQSPLTVFAAASLKESMDAAATAYQHASGQPVRVSYAASSALARQIAQGAPADAFVSADEDWMDDLQRRNLIDTASRRDLLGNRLVLIAPASSPMDAMSLQPGVDLLAPLGADGRLAVALTDSVPAGKYARAALLSLGAWSTLQPRLAEAENVRAALLLVARGETPLGIVYASDAQAEPRVKVLAVFPADAHPPIVYPVARLERSSQPQASAFIDWLQTPVAAEIFRRYGFSMPPESR